MVEIRMFSWICASVVTKKDRIRIKRIRGTAKVGGISTKVQERRLKWYGRDEEYVRKRMIRMDV